MAGGGSCSSLLKEHDKLLQYNLHHKPQNRVLPKFVDANINLGGTFVVEDGIEEYVGGRVYKAWCLWLSQLDCCYLREQVKSAMKVVYDGSIASNFSIWYRVKTDEGVVKKLVESEDDIKNLLMARDLMESIAIYVVEY